MKDTQVSPSARPTTAPSKLERGSVVIGPLVLASAFAFGASGCGSDQKEANTAQAPQCPPEQYFDGNFCVGQQAQGVQPGQPQGQPTQPGQTAQPGQPAPQGQAPAPGQPAQPAPVATGQAGPAATPLDPTAAQAATQILAQLGPQHAPAGARAMGDAIAGQFQQGQSLETQIQMTQGKCYTVVAAGLPPIGNVDIQLLPAVQLPGLASPVLAQDQAAGPNAVIGEKPNCFKWAFFNAPVKLVVTVSQGSGIAAAQVFEK